MFSEQHCWLSRVAAEENILQSYIEIRLLNCENIPVVKIFQCILLLVKLPHEIEIFFLQFIVDIDFIYENKITSLNVR
jgi:hypothetical protein